MRRLCVSVGLVLVAVSLAGPAAAQPAAAASGFKADILANFDEAAKKLVDLAQATPADKYGWRPAPGVRSVSEVYMHVAFDDYFIPSFLGAKMPEGVDRSMETTVTAKAQVVEAFQKSVANARAAIASVPDSDMDQKVKIFGREMSRRAIVILLASHLHEHLGQSIAYARSNGVVPPWSASEGAPPAKKPSN